MTYFKLSIVFAAIFAFAVACATTPTTTDNKPVATTNTTVANVAPPTDDFASSKKIYSEKCVNCHKADGLGGMVDGVKVPSYKAEKAMSHFEAKMVEIITNGDDDMPAYGKKLSETEIKDLVKMIRKDFQGR